MWGGWGHGWQSAWARAARGGVRQGARAAGDRGEVVRDAGWRGARAAGVGVKRRGQRAGGMRCCARRAASAGGDTRNYRCRGAGIWGGVQVGTRVAR
ncbi:hypothetical protein PAHAL_5G225700 [Panicum hallii]|jgi:hypothetical protein|uniref:Uncharacterized protein n=1 Tax=Panicum hallii TaxID=206008 RepID=A0A2T8IKV8_9POAL|nr:hypothetical protein PAHAL_5G225700 [Panicum hallii]